MLTIVPMTSELLPLYNQVDNRYLAGEITQVKAGRLGFSLEYLSLPKAQWHTPAAFTSLPGEALIQSPDMACFLAFDAGRLIGQAVVLEGPSALAQVWDIRVDPGERRKKIGTGLLNACIAWARERSMQGLMLEASDENPTACRFAEQFGFLLGGVDKLRLRSLPGQREKPPAFRASALTFYYFFQ